MKQAVKKFFGIKSKTEYDREKEMDYRMKIAKAHREAMAIRRNMEKQKSRAIECERNGEHGKAVTYALQAEKMQKAIDSAEVQLQQCTSIHDLAEIQRAMVTIMATCRDLSNGIVELADMEGSMQIQAENEEALARLVETGEQMEMYAEGIGADVMPEVRNAAGEAALASILAEVNKPETPVQSQTILTEIRTETVPATDTDGEDAWVRSRREDLQALAADL